MSTEDAPMQKFTDAQLSWLITHLWDAMQAPTWKRVSTSDLEKLGEALHSGKTLPELDDKLFDRIFPHLKIIAERMGEAIFATGQDRLPGLPEHAPPTQESAQPAKPAPKLVAVTPSTSAAKQATPAPAPVADKDGTTSS